MVTTTVQHPLGWNGSLPPKSEDLPRGLVSPPPVVQDIIARETQRLGPHVMTAEAQKRLVEDFTLQYYYEGFTVAYRRTPQGVDVLAVDSDEIARFTQGLSQEELLTLHVRQP